MITLRDIGPDGLKALREKQAQAEAEKFAGGAVARKSGFDARLQIDAENHRAMIEARVRKVHESKEIADQISKHVGIGRNVLLRVVNAVAVAYDTPPIREVRDVPEEQKRKLLQAYREAETNSTAPNWGRYAFLCNVVHVLPRIEADRGLQWVTVLPHEADVLWDPDGERDPSILVYTCNDLGASFVAVDAERWWWLDDQGEVIDEEEHQIGMRPWAEFRVAPRKPGDYWARNVGRNLVDATLNVGRISAHMDWIRRTAARKTSAMFVGENDEIPPGQVLQGEAPVIVRGDGSSFQVYDTIVSPAEFLADIAAIFEDVAEHYGLPVTAIDPSQGSTSDAANVFGPAGPRVHERLVKLRNSQTQQLGHGETQLAIRTAALLTANGRLNVKADQARDGFRLRWAPATYADTPKAQAEAAGALMSNGLASTDPVAFHQSQNPGMTFEEAREDVLRHIEVSAEIHDIQASRNLPSDPAKLGETLPQMQGRIGGQMAAANRLPDGEHDDEEKAEYDA
jgi:hypothetical protein